jgi:chloramphenicol-sensitive protein RarD
MIPYLSAFGAYLTWGLSPIFWKLLSNFQIFELASYRVIFSVLCLLPFLSLNKISVICQKIKKNPFITLFSCVLMFINIYLFVYAVNSGQILEASFGYFMSPLLSMALAYFILEESLSKVKIIAIALAFIGICIKLSTFEHFPWVSLVLGGCFSIYGLLRKYSKMNAFEITFSEMTCILGPALLIVSYHFSESITYYPMASNTELVLLCFVWVPTLIPFILFSHAAKHIELNILSFIQYLAPSIQFVLAIYYYNEKIMTSQWISFILVWCACLLVIISRLMRGHFERK